MERPWSSMRSCGDRGVGLRRETGMFVDDRGLFD
jgi:hypothetical protein